MHLLLFLLAVTVAFIAGAFVGSNNTKTVKAIGASLDSLAASHAKVAAATTVVAKSSAVPTTTKT